MRISNYFIKPTKRKLIFLSFSTTSMLFLSNCGRQEDLPEWDQGPSYNSFHEEETSKEDQKMDKRLIGTWKQPGWLYSYLLTMREDGTATHIVTLPNGSKILDIDTKQETNVEQVPHRASGLITAVRVSAIPDRKPVKEGDGFHCLYEFDAKNEDPNAKEKLKMFCALDGTIPKAIQEDGLRILEKQVEKKKENNENS
jgi:hypothetical protein